MNAVLQQAVRSAHAADATLASLAFADIVFGAGNDSDVTDKAIRMAKAMQSIEVLPDGEFDDPVFDTLVAVPGIVLDGPVIQATKLWNAKPDQFKHFLIGGYRGERRVKEMFDQQVVTQHFGIQNAEHVRSHGLTQHAGTQAAWVAKQALELGSRGLLVVVPRFHSVRWIATLAEMLRREIGEADFARIPIAFLPYQQNVYAATLLDVKAEAAAGEDADPNAFRTLTEAECIHGEYQRCINYQVKPDGSDGDVMTTDRFEAYVAWFLSEYG